MLKRLPPLNLLHIALHCNDSTMPKSHTASTVKPTNTSTTLTKTQKSSILRSSFAPSRFQLRLFASIIQSFESQQLRIHDTSTGRLRCQHSAKPGTRITCLDWGYAKGQVSGTPRNKTKKKDDILLAYGTSSSDICLFSPTEARVLGELSGVHERGILDLKFSQVNPHEAWSIGGDGKLVQWDVQARKALRTISLPEHDIKTLAPIISASSILCASNTPYLIQFGSSSESRSKAFVAMKSQIHSLHASDSTSSILAADGDRYINLYNSSTQRLIRTLIAGSEVSNLDLDESDEDDSTSGPHQLLAVLGRSGILELFPQPFTMPQSRNGDLKSSRKNLTQKCTASVRLVDSSSRQAAIFAMSIQGPEICLASVEGGVELSFQKLRWQDEGSGELLFSGVKDVVRAKSASTLASATTNGVKDMGNPHVDESSTVVSDGMGITGSQDAAIEIASSDEEGEEAESEPEAEAEDIHRGHDSDASSDQEMEDAPAEPSSTVQAPTSEPVQPEEPTFGDLVANAQPINKTISITSAFPSQAPALMNTSGALTLPTGMSLGTVLTQSLRTNDRSLLEACLHTTDTSIIRNTITRLDSSLAGLLIGKLAERIVSRPGRYGHLQIWVQHLCVAHGAAISANPDARHKLKELYRALDARAKGLNSLLLLKGKLQMVEGQLRFRREIAAQRAEAGLGGPNTRPVTIHIEGQADNWDSDADDYDEISGSKPTKRARKALDDLVRADPSNDEDEDEDMPATLPNGVASDSDNEESSSSDSDDDDVQQRPNGMLLDEEAEEEDAESDEGVDIASDDDDDDDEDSNDAEEDDEDEEGDSETDSFINDGDISVEADDELLDDAPPATPADAEEEEQKPKVKRRRA